MKTPRKQRNREQDSALRGEVDHVLCTEGGEGLEGEDVDVEALLEGDLEGEAPYVLHAWGVGLVVQVVVEKLDIKAHEHSLLAGFTVTLPFFSSLSGLQALKLRLQGVPQGGVVLEPPAGHVDTEEVAKQRTLLEHWRAQ